MTIIKKCKDCKHFMIDCSFLKVDKDFHVMEDFITCKHFKPKNETNADRIRSMTDEEMADRLTVTVKCDECFIIKEHEPYCLSTSVCKQKHLEWLQSEAE